ncbi:ABC transporter ATP-binding protein [Phosphitispora sp. TUW77]|uniref:ABC transporter ATP-binding protein n=1 Tax=Phosphitispora sp. TUW77 TaxID=3152361 RepID=UPI003AB3FA05
MRKTRQLIQWIKPNLMQFIPVLAVIMLIQVLGSLMSVATALASKNMIDYAVANELRLAAIVAGVFVLLVIGNLLMQVGVSLLSVRVTESLSNSMRQRVFHRLLGTEWQSLTAYHSGDLLTRMTSDVSNITNTIVNVIPGMFALAAQLVASFSALLYFEPYLAVFAFVLGPCSVIFSRIWGRTLKHLQIKVQESESAYRSHLQEALQNFIVIKCFGLEKHNEDSLQRLHENRMKWVIKKNKKTLAANNMIALGYWSGYMLAFGWGAYRLSQKAISFGTMTAFLQLVQQVQGPFVGLARTIPKLINMTASMERLIELEDMEREKITERVPVIQDVGIVFQDVHFDYSPGRAVLSNVTIQILPGQLVALVGSSGEGKTTLIRLLLSLIRPTSGELYFTDRNGRRYEVSATTRDWFTYVPQENTLFSGTIADNLLSGKPDATMEEMEMALRMACAADFIVKLPQGLDTVVGERGLRLSEGQAQRIAIARAFLRKAPVMIFDEATSALDVETEKHVLQAMKDMGDSRTCLIITHRLTALKICSRVLRIEDGKLVEDFEKIMLTGK